MAIIEKSSLSPFLDRTTRIVTRRIGRAEIVMLVRMLMSALVLSVLCQSVLAEESIEKRMTLLFGENEKHIAFFHDLKHAVLRDDQTKVADLMKYPLDVFTRGKRTIVRSKNEFIKRYREVINENVVRAIKAQEAKDLFANWRGVMIGHGQVWFSGICTGKQKGQECSDMSIKVITINRDAPPT